MVPGSQWSWYDSMFFCFYLFRLRDGLSSSGSLVGSRNVVSRVSGYPFWLFIYFFNTSYTVSETMTSRVSRTPGTFSLTFRPLHRRIVSYWSSKRCVWDWRTKTIKCTRSTKEVWEEKCFGSRLLSNSHFGETEGTGRRINRISRKVQQGINRYVQTKRESFPHCFFVF